MLAELQIRCEFFDRGCGKFVQLGDLERHVADCGFAPAICSNEGCQLEGNKQDLLHHETAVCELRRVKCHSCNYIRREMDTVKVNLAAMNETLDKNQKAFDTNEKQIKTLSSKIENIKVDVKAGEKNVIAKVEQIQHQLNKQEESNRRLEAEVVEIKKKLNEIMKKLEKMTQQTSHEVQAEEMKKEVAEAVVGMEREPKVVIAGGRSEKNGLNSVEMFSLTNGTWTPLKQMKERRRGASSVVYNDHIFVSGGWAGSGNWLKSIEKISLNAVQVDLSTSWEKVPAELPGQLSDHCSVVYNGRVIIVGGYDADKSLYSDSITEISLVPPYISKLLATMTKRRGFHGVATFADKILIVGGNNSAVTSVVVYDIIKKECQELAPLPYPVYDMAIVKWNDDNVIIMGGVNSITRPSISNKVLMYNIKTQKSHELPNMKYRRRGCVAAVVKDTVIVMGGQDGRGNYLKSVEGFRFDRNSWEELPPMHEGRCWATAVVC